MRRILVTGGSGLIGRALQQVSRQLQPSILLQNCVNVKTDSFIFTSSKEYDLTSLDATRALFQRYKPTHVIHLAARIGGLFCNMTSPVEMWLHNVAINNHVMQCAHQHHVQKLVSCLSTCIFPSNVTIYPINEVMLHDGPPHSSNEPYAYAKRMIDVLARAYRAEYHDHFISVIPTNVYGQHDNYHLHHAHVVAAITRRMFQAKRQNKPYVTIYGTGNPLRQFIYSVNLAQLILWVLYNYDEVQPIILAPDAAEQVSIKTLAQLIADAMQYEGQFVFDNTKADGQYRKTVDNSKLRCLLPQYKFTPLTEGLQRCVNWFLQHHDDIRKE